MDKGMAIAQVTRMRVGESDGTSGTASIGAVWRNGDGVVGLPRANRCAAAAVCQSIGRGGETAVAAGAGVLPDAGYSYTMRNFEDVVIFVTDMEKAIEKLSVMEKQLLAMNILEEYTVDEVARLLGIRPGKFDGYSRSTHSTGYWRGYVEEMGRGGF
jgi:hypothetical protein